MEGNAVTLVQFGKGMLSFRPSFGGACCHSGPVLEGMLSFRPSFGGACSHSAPVSEGHAVTPIQFRMGMLSFCPSFSGACCHSALNLPLGRILAPFWLLWGPEGPYGPSKGTLGAPVSPNEQAPYCYLFCL